MATYTLDPTRPMQSGESQSQLAPAGTLTNPSQPVVTTNQAETYLKTIKDAIAKDDIEAAKQSAAKQATTAPTVPQKTNQQPTTENKPLPDFYYQDDNTTGQRSYFDTQGNPIGQPAGGNGEPVPTSLNPVTQANAGIQKALSEGDQALSDYNASMAQLRNGTYPLTSDQQAQLHAMDNQFNALVDAQKVANANEQGAVNQAGIMSGRSMYAPEIQVGNVARAVNSGIAKIANIEAERASSIAKLKEGFRTDNIKIIQDAYNTYSKALESKESVLRDMRDKIQKSLQDTRDYNYRVAQDKIKNALDSEEFSWKQKQDAINNAISQAKLDEDKRSHLVAEAQKQETINLQKQANQILAGATAPAVSTINGAPSQVEQEKFLSQFSPTIQTQIKGITDYSIDPADFSTSARQAMGGLTKSQIVALAKQYDPSYDDKEYSARKKFLQSWKAGGQNSTITAANTVVQHLNTLKGTMDKLATKGLLTSSTLGVFTKKYNSVQAWLEANKGNPDIGEVNQDFDLIATEIAKIYKNGTNSNAAPGKDEIDAVKEDWYKNLTPDNIDGLIKNGAELMGSKLQVSRDNYYAQMGKNPTNILFPSSKSALDNLVKKMGGDASWANQVYDPSPYGSMDNNSFINSVNSGSAKQDNSSFFEAFMNANASALGQ